MDALERRSSDLRAVISEHHEVARKAAFVAIVCNSCSRVVAAATIEELRALVADWLIADTLGGDDYCPSCS